MEQSEPLSARKISAPKSRQNTREQDPNESLHVKSKNKADTAFRDFSVSRFPKGSKPTTYVDPAGGPAAVHSAQRQVITQQLNRLDAINARGGMTLALPESQIGKLLPSLNAKSATIDLGDVLKVIAPYMAGAEFYADGNPVLNRLALQARARELIAAMKQDPTADPGLEEAKAAPSGRGRWLPLGGRR